MKKNYDITEDISNKRKNIDFNEYGLNKYNDIDYNVKFSVKTGPNCVKRKIK